MSSFVNKATEWSHQAANAAVNATQHVVDAVRGEKDINKLPITQQKKVLMALTSVRQKMPDGHETGWFWPELNHPFEELRKAGYDCDIVSENGQQYLDQTSLGLAYSSVSDKLKHDNPQYILNEKIRNIKPATAVSADGYCAIFFVGGHGCMWDFPKATNLQRLAAQIYEQGGVIGAVCHGTMALEDLKDSRGNLIANGKTVTGFSAKGEAAMGVLDWIHQQGLKTVEESVKAAGAVWKEHDTNPMACYTLVDGRIVTGMNPASAGETAQKMVPLLSSSTVNLGVSQSSGVVVDQTERQTKQGDPLFDKGLGVAGSTTTMEKEKMLSEGGGTHHIASSLKHQV